MEDARIKVTVAICLLALAAHGASACGGGSTDGDGDGDGDGDADLDRDGDGYPEGEDCDDTDPTINPGNGEEICGNGIDENCRVDIEGCDNGDLPCDADADGFRQALSATCGTDCDDSNPDVNPAAYEGQGADPSDPSAAPGCFDDIDNDCDGVVDESCCSPDGDRDGSCIPDDCEDCNAGVSIGAVDRCGDGVDQDCSGEDAVCDPSDADGDGAMAAPAGTDCNDTEPRIFPGAPDYCGDGIAQDCLADEPCDDDADGDGYNSAYDCDDSNPDIHPWGDEVCDADGADEDCDGVINEVEAPGDSGCIYSPSTESWVVVVYATDLDHCGGCRHQCDAGLLYREGSECIDGACTCYGAASCAGDVTSYCCPDGCQDISSDPTHCGDCYTQCVPGEECRPSGAGGLGECF